MLFGEVYNMQTETKYFVFGHTAKGLVHVLNSNIANIERLIVLQHDSNTIISQMMERLIKYYKKFDHVEVICSPQNKQYVDGIIMRQLSIAILSSKIVTYNLPNAVYIIIDQWNDKTLDGKLLKDYNEQQNKLFQDAYSLFEQGLLIHDQLEEIYINEMDFAKADQETENMIEFLFKNSRKLDKDSRIYKRLFGTNTADGMINYVEELIEPIERRIFIKGRAG